MDPSNTRYYGNIDGLYLDDIVRGRVTEDKKVELGRFLKNNPDKELEFFKTQPQKGFFSKIFSSKPDANDFKKLAEDFIAFKQKYNFSRVEVEKLKTPRSNLANLERLFNIATTAKYDERHGTSIHAPTAGNPQATIPRKVGEQDLTHGDKIAFLVKNLDRNRPKAPIEGYIKELTQAKKYPLVAEALNAFAYNYDEWSEGSRNRLEQQHANLALMLEWCKQHPELAARIPVDKTNLELLGECLEGKGQLTPEILSSLQPLPERKLPEQGQPNVSNRSIQAQIEMIDTYKNTKLAIEETRTNPVPEQRHLKSRGDSGGADVYQIIQKNKPPATPPPTRVPKGLAPEVAELYAAAEEMERSDALFPERTVGFIKMSFDEDDSVGRLETIAFQIADNLGLGDQFATTRMVSVEANRSTEGRRAVLSPQKKDVKVDPDPKIKESDKEKAKNKPAALSGSLQVPLPGETLKSYMGSDMALRRIPYSELSRVVLTASVMGMYDLNDTNLIVVEKMVVEDDGRGGFKEAVEGVPKLFDNSRAVPNGNGMIRQGIDVFGTTRNVLLGHPQAFQRYTSAELATLKDQIKALRKNVDQNLKPLLQSKFYSQKIIGGLPEHWMDPKAAYEALNERLMRIESAIAAGRIQSPLDIAFAADPVFKFSAATALLKIPTTETVNNSAANDVITQLKGNVTDQQKRDLQKMMLSFGGYFKLTEMVSFCRARKIDPQVIWDLSQRPNITADELLHEVLKVARESQQKYLTIDGESDLTDRCQKFLNEKTEAATVDFKDVDGTSNSHCLSMLIDSCKRYQIPIVQANTPEELKGLEVMISNLQPYNFLYVTDGKDPANVEVIFRSNDGIVVRDKINYDDKPGKVQFQGAKQQGYLTVDEWRRKLTPEHFFGKLLDPQVRSIGNKAPNNSWMLFTNEHNELTLFRKRPNGYNSVEVLKKTNEPGVYMTSAGERLTLSMIERYMNDEEYTPLKRP